MNSPAASLRRLLAVAGLALAISLACAGGANADSALLTRSGVLYEVFRAPYGEVVSGVPEDQALYPVLALRTTRAGAPPVVSLVGGTVSSDEKGSASIGFDEITGTVVVVYVRFQGIMTDVHFAALRADTWIDRSIVPTAGLYLSLNPQLLVTRQTYTDADASFRLVQKSRTIVSIVWWEEGGRSQARYAPVFIEDGHLGIDEITAYNLNELAGFDGATNSGTLPFSSYQFPALQRDLSSNGGVLASFVNLITQRHTVLKVSIPDDIRDPITGRIQTGTQAYVRIHSPIGRIGRDGRIPREIATTGTVGTVVTPESFVPSFYWEEDHVVRVLPGDAPEGQPATTIPLRSDLNADRVLAVVRELAVSN